MRMALTHRGFLLGPWVAAARAMAGSEAEAAQNEWNLRTQARKPLQTKPRLSHIQLRFFVRHC